MENNLFITAFVFIPLLGFLVSLILPKAWEQTISVLTISTTLLQLFLAIIFTFLWMLGGSPKLNMEELVIYKSGEYRFFIDFYFDWTSAIFLLVGSSISFLIARYSRYYMHMEEGYKRFFNTFLVFFFAYNWTILSGNFETLFIGWEVLGVSSFLLIAFYRERYLPVKNAVKVFSIYRIGDIGILAAMWASHHLWHENITFLKLDQQELVHDLLEAHSGTGIFIGMAILLAAAAKSAQIPFSSWLPRAMEGPTPSSAIFYGSLSVHLGVFLLLRTYSFWHEQELVKILIGTLGILTAVMAYFTTRVQSSIKPQIAYASVTQIGIIFLELALGLQTLALIHFAGNAFLRTYQLLISPSVVSYRIRDQFYHFEEQVSSASGRLKMTLYHLALNEWYLDYFMTNWVFSGLKKGGKLLNFLSVRNVFVFFIPLYLLGIYFYFYQASLPTILKTTLPEIIAFSGLLMVLKAFSERNHPRLALLLVVFSHFTLALSVSFNEHFHIEETIIFLSGVLFSGIVAFLCLQFLKKKVVGAYSLNDYYGHGKAYPRLANTFLLCVLGLTGFPITPTFIGEDLLFSHIHEDQYLLGALVAFGFVIGGVALIRVYARVFLGTPSKNSGSNPIKST